MIHALERMRVDHKLWLVLTLTLAGMLIVSAVSLYSLEHNLLEDRKIATKHVVETVWGVLEQYEQRVRAGELSTEEAQRQAVATIKALRYEGKEYFWINDMHPTMVMHPLIQKYSFPS